MQAKLEGALQGRLADLTAYGDTAGLMLWPVEPRSLTPSQCAELIDVSTRTLRRYSSMLSNSLSEPASKRGRKRFYSSQDVDTLRRAQKMMRQGMTLKDIAEVLPIQPANDVEQTALTLSPEANLALGGVIERQRQEGEENREINQNQDERLDRLEEWAKQSWWKKLFSSPD